MFGLALSSLLLSVQEACLLLGYQIFLLGKGHLGMVPPLLHLSLALLLMHWILLYSCVGFLTQLLHHVWSLIVLYVLRELLLEGIFIFFH